MYLLPLIVFSQLMMLVLVTLVLRKTNILARQTSDLLGTYLDEEVEDSSDSMETSTQEDMFYEEHMAERALKFDQRITQIKEDLGTQAIPQKPTTIAETPHPEVQNLPHDSIPDYENNLPSVEYAD